MFERRDVIPSLFLFLLIIIIMVTLSQILVVHHNNHHGNRPRELRKFHELIRELEKCIESMLKKDVLPLEKYEHEFRAVIYANRIAQLVNKTKSTITTNTTQNELQPQHYMSYILNDDRKARHLQNMHMPSYVNSAEYEDRSTHTNLHLKPATSINMGISGAGTGNVKSKTLEHINDVDYSRYWDKDATEIRTKQGSTSWSQYTSWRRHVKEDLTHQASGMVVLCPAVPADLLGALNIDLNNNLTNGMTSRHDDMLPGGAWRPRDCVARHRVAVVIPYRNRRQHLMTLLHYLVPVLERQQLDFRIFVVEQAGNKAFNKGRVMNAAFNEASKMADFQCFIFHDVDLVPEDDRNMYTCPHNPRHMSPAVDKFHYKLPYAKLVGGVFSIQAKHFETVNGYSNLYWGWGAEDDDMAKRLKAKRFNITRPPATIGRYKMIKHSDREVAPLKWRLYLLRTVEARFHKDGLNSLTYETVFINNTSLYTHIMVDVGDPPKSVPTMSLIMH